MKKLLFVSYSADWTGPTKSLSLLLRHLRRDYQVAVALPGWGAFAEETSDRGIPVHSFRNLGKWSIPGMLRLLRRDGFHLVYANTDDGSARNAFLAARLAGARYICHVRALARDKPWSRLWYLRFANAVVAVSKACAESLRRFVPPERLHVIYNGVPLPPPEARPDGVGNGAVPDSRDGASDGSCILAVGHVCQRKGQADAVRAMPRILEAEPQARLCIVGAEDREPNYVEEVRQLTRELGLDGQVHLLGFRDDVPSLLQRADLLLHTAAADPHPRAILEAMAAGVPVVAFAVDGVAETVVDGTSGRLVRPGDRSGLADAVIHLLGDPEARARFGEAGRSRVAEKFRDTEAARRVKELIELVLSRRDEWPAAGRCRGPARVES